MTARLPDLGRALLTPDDLPDGWVTADPDALERLFQSRMPSGLCGVGAVINSEIADAEVRATYRRTGEGRYADHLVARWAGGRAALGMAAFRAQIVPLLPCAWRESDVDGTATRWEASLTPLPALGDEALGLHVAFTGDAGDGRADVVIIRRGDAVATLGVLAIGGADGADDATLAAQLAARADARLALLPP